MPEIPFIYQAITKVMEEVGYVGKNQKNQQQGFMFRGIDAVMNAIYPALVKNKVFIVPEVLEQEREERKTKNGTNMIYSICKIRYTFFAADGSSVSAVVIGEGMDTGDKATNKAMAIAFKYACFQVFCIPTEEMKDPDAESYELVKKERFETNRQGEKGENDVIRQQEAKMKSETNLSFIEQEKIEMIRTTIQQKGLKERSVLDNYGIRNFEEMRLEYWEDAMKILAKYKDKGMNQS